MTNFILGFLLGILTFVGYGAFRALRSDGWDNSNLLNWLRVLSHVFIHPEDLGECVILSGTQHLWLRNDASPDRKIFRPFWYVSGDEFRNVVKTRP